jgi:molecular chaperone DnaK (HSP70)
MESDKICLSIDFGTSNSVMSIFYEQNIIIIKEDENNIIPSVIELNDNKKIVGINAYNRQKIFNELDVESLDVIYEIKKMIGKKYSDLEKEHFEYLGYSLNSDENDNIIINSKYRPEEILTHLFMSFKSIAEDFMFKHYNLPELKNVIISVPVKFNDIQRKTIIQCATNANFNVLKLLNESTSASIAYGLNNCNDEKNVIVFDLGAGTLDISYCNICDNNFEVIGTSGNNNLGGSNFDKKIMEYCVSKFIDYHNIEDIEYMMDNINPSNMQKLKYLAEQAKISLNDNDKTKIKISDFYDSKELNVLITKNDLNELFKVLMQLIIKPLNDLLEVCEIEKKDVDEIIMVGGMTKFYMVYQTVETFFGKELNNSMDPDLVVSTGSAIYGHQLLNKTDLKNNLMLIDRTSLSLGIDTTGGIMDIFIPRNSIMPIKKSKKYTTDQDFMESITIKIFEGDRKMTKDNIHIGDLVLSGIEPEKRGIPEIKVEFSIDQYGTIKVKAEDLKNNINKKSTIINKKNLSKEEIDEIIQKSILMDNLDRIERSKKRYYQILISNSNKIIENLKVEELTLKEEIKNSMIDEITQMLEWLKSKTFDEIDLDKYKEMQKHFETQYSIFLTAQPTVYKVASIEEKLNGVKIYEDDINYSKYTEQILYFKDILYEYKTLKEKNILLNSQKFYFLTNITKEEIINFLIKESEIMIQTVDDILIELITTPQTDETVKKLCDKIYEMDIHYKTFYLKYEMNFNLIKYVECALEKSEEIALNNDDEEVLNKIVEYHTCLYEMKNKYIDYDEKILLNILLDLKNTK